MTEVTDFEGLAARNAERAAQLGSRIHQLRPAERRELDIRTAIERFVASTTKTDGSWTIVNLVAESGVPRPSLYRYQQLVEEFQALASVVPAGRSGTQERIRDLGKQVRTMRADRTAERRDESATRAVLVERLHGLSLALAHATGRGSIADLGSRRGNKP